MTFDEFLAKFRTDQLRVAEHGSWIATVRLKQVTIGSTVLIPKHPFADLGDLSGADASDLFAITKIVQDAVRASFGAEKFNLIAAMMKDPFVHFHLIPRYSKPVLFAGETFTDSDWPTLVSFRDVETTETQRSAVRDQLIRTLGEV